VANIQCQPGEICDQTGHCGPCSPSNTQGGCDEGDYCDPSGVCTAAPSCPDVSEPTIRTPGEGAVIWGTTLNQRFTDPGRQCRFSDAGPAPIDEFAGYYYEVNANGFPAPKQAVLYVKDDGGISSIPDGGTLANASGNTINTPTLDGGVFTFQLCTSTVANRKAVGVIVRDLLGNPSNTDCIPVVP
jgi:hypothetical protein